jgi:hypothetical protein
MLADTSSKPEEVSTMRFRSVRHVYLATMMALAALNGAF